MKKQLNITLINIALFLTLSYLVIFVGQNNLNPFSLTSSNIFIIESIRIPLYISAILIGVVFATSGLMMQLLFKNNLATPYTLGISSGAVFFILIGAKFGIDIKFFSEGSPLVYSISGTLLILIILLKFLPKRASVFNTTLLIGIALNIFFSSAMMLLQYYSSSSELYQMTHWLVGSIEIIDKIDLLPTIIFWIFLVIYVIKFAPEIDLLSINSQLALDRGIDIKKIAKIIIILQAFSLGALIPFTGPIAFVGLIIPNIVRIFIHSGVKTLLYYSVLGGANFMLLAHFLSMRVKSGEIIPVGIITAIVGAVFLIVSLASQIKE